MGDGEIMGAAIEGAMNVEVYVELIKKQATPIPRIENADEVMFVGSGRPLEDAARVAFKAMVGWVRERSGMSEMDAYQFVSQNAKAPIIQLVDPEYTVLVKLEKGVAGGRVRGRVRVRVGGCGARLSRVDGEFGTAFMLPSMNMYRLWSHGHNRVHHGFTSYTPVDWIWRPLTPEAYAAKSRWGRVLYRLERSPFTCALHYLLRVWWPGMVMYRPDKHSRDGGSGEQLVTWSSVAFPAWVRRWGNGGGGGDGRGASS